MQLSSVLNASGAVFVAVVGVVSFVAVDTVVAFVVAVVAVVSVGVLFSVLG